MANSPRNAIVYAVEVISDTYGMNPAIFRGLEVFCAVVEAGSATAAARKLGMSQPAVSQQIAKLEAELSLTLFVRENGRMRPTATAISIYEESRHAFDGLTRVVNLARDINGLDRGHLRVAVPHSMSAVFLPRVLSRLTAGRPELRLRIMLGTYENIAGQIAARKVDIGIAKAPVLNPGVETIEVAVSRLVAVSAPGLARPKGPLGVRDLAQEPLIMVGRDRPWRDEIDVAFRREGVAPKVRVETHSVESACGMAAEGFGTAIVPEWLFWGLDRADLELRVLDLGIQHRFLVGYPASAKRDDLAKDFARTCCEVAQDYADKVTARSV